MNLSKQKIDIYDKIDRINAKISDLQQKAKVLQNGVEAIEKGEDMLNGTGMLAFEVRDIMSDED